MVLDDAALLEKHNITGESSSEEQNIEVNIKAREINITKLSVTKRRRKYEAHETEDVTKE